MRCAGVFGEHPAHVFHQSRSVFRHKEPARITPELDEASDELQNRSGVAPRDADLVVNYGPG